MTDEEKFAEHLEMLAQAYAIQHTEITVTQIVDLGVSLEKETPEDVFLLLNDVFDFVQENYIRFGSKPNVLIDAYLGNVLKSTRTVPQDYAFLFWARIDDADILWKNFPSDFEFDLECPDTLFA